MLSALGVADETARVHRASRRRRDVARSWRLPLRAQQGDRMRRIGVLMAYAESD